MNTAAHAPVIRSHTFVITGSTEIGLNSVGS